ncbi:hypothetical protein EXIGLDRAFT_816556 [Exidia glandulosa HHB12029]|uniref:Ricin B lectin domain-containing protein n=1 Tax=Exidia glandulosa HHB12029 TaxID=1314781 RepID=A0A165KMN7_EXIGL|nr:hypothetical protein EXIGLDRAFT_816556 [Exidia glandulosa HHB12029]
MFTASLFALALSAVALAVDTTSTVDCVTKFAGILSTNSTSGQKSFTLNSAGQVAYLGTGASPLVVQFQVCQSLQKSNQVPNTQTGRLFVPSEGKCIGTTNNSNAAAPYYTTLVKCGTGVSQRFQVYSNQNNAIYWYGATASDGTFFQGGCGSLGYKAEADGTPVITHTRQQITLECNSKAPFHLNSRAA